MQKGIPHTNGLKLLGHEQMVIEHRTVYNMRGCEMSVFETSEKAYSVPLAFNDLVISTMLSGKKIMRLPFCKSFEFVPGQSMILPPGQIMDIDFPEACMKDPVQCVTLSIGRHHIDKARNFLEESYVNPDNDKSWDLQFNRYHFQNDDAITELINRIIKNGSSTDRAKDIYVELNLQELLVRLVQSENLAMVEKDAIASSNKTRLHFAIAYIHQNLGRKISIEQLCRKSLLNRSDFFRLFKEQFGISPVEYITLQRVKAAKDRMASGNYNLQQIGSELGFGDASYFTRVFKKSEGLTPGQFLALHRDKGLSGQPE